MRVAVYNQMFGLNGKSFFSNLLGHYRIHLRADSDKFWSMTSLDRTIRIIKKSNADVVAICEILEGQENELKSKLKKIGYNYIYFGEGHKTRFRNLQIKVAIASKIKCKKEYLKKEPIENKLGGGGGFVDCYFPKLNLNVLCVHLGLRKSLREKQIRFLKNHLKKKEKFILLGDFNCCFDKLSSLKDLELVSDRIKTCSLTPILKWFFWKDCDHIFVRKLKEVKTEFLEGYSDHRLIYTDLE
jgi:endonuclease/exonuclease/phosphatase family metal-dependent hydrolase